MDGKLAAGRNTHSHLSGVLESSMNTKLLLTKERMGALAGRLDALSPLKKLTGGYGYVTVNGKPVKSAGDVQKGDTLSARFSDGTVKAAVTAVER